MDVKKFNGTSWETTPSYVYKTATDTITPPTTIYADGTAATIGLKGNTVQNGTPTPSNPVDVVGVGNKTAQLYNSTDTTWIDGVLDANGQNTGSTLSHYTGNFTKVNENTTYCLSGSLGQTGNAHAIYFYDINKNWISRTSGMAYDVYAFTTPANCEYIQIQAIKTINSTADWMLNTGPTTIDFEPYGYKIPISSASTTTPVYLGEVQTTRRIKKLVLTGEESDWRTSGDGAAQIFNHTIGLYADLQPYAICNMFYQSNNAAGYNNSFDIVRSSGNGVIRFNNSGIASTTAAWKTYLQQQYTAGTPVVVYYVLATPTTGIVNEPLMKIGSYSDSISGISIPTTDGANALSIGTTVQPSEVTAAYHGWHTGAVHERESGSWD